MAQPTASTVTSRDGTEIAYFTSGDGPPLVLVHGVTADHTRWAPLLPHLEPYATVHAIDRRGRGASGDARDYDVSRELEDVAAVVDAVAEASGGPVDLLGHSFGANCALGAATLTSNLRRLVLYEPAKEAEAAALPPEIADPLDVLLAEGNREAVVETVFRQILNMPDEQLNAFREAPSWPGRVAAAHTLPRELRTASQLARLDASGITVPTLFVSGADSLEFMKSDTQAWASIVPNARITVIEGQGHTADVLVPEIFAEHILVFLRDGG